MRLAVPVAALLVSVLCTPHSLALAAAGGPPVALIRQGDAVAGIGTVTSLGDRVAVDASGGWLLRVTTATDTAVLQDGTVAKRVGDAVNAPAGATITGFASFDVSASGDVAWILDLSTSARAVYYGDTLVAQTGSAPLDSAGAWVTATYTDFNEVFVNDSGQVLLGGTALETGGFLIHNEFLSLITVDGSGAPVSEYVRYRTEWPMPDFSSGFTDSVPVRPESTALDEHGHSVFYVRENAGQRDAILRDLTTGPGGPTVCTMILATWDNGPGGMQFDWTALAGADLNAAHDWVAVIGAADVNWGPITDRIVVSTGGVLAQRFHEGEALAAIAPSTLVSLGVGGPVHLTDAGEVVWYGSWSDPDTTRDEGLFLDGELLVQEGVTTSGGSVIEALDPASFTISPEGRFIAFRGRLAGGIEGAFRIDLLPPITAFCSGDGSATPCPCGNAGAAGRGCDNSFATGGGLLVSSGFPSVAADDLVLSASGMPTSATALYFQGTSQQSAGLGAVFGDGLRCAGGTIFRLGTKTSAGGASSFGAGVGTDPLISVRGLVPVGGATRTYQVWYRNSAAFCTAALFNLTNGLEVAWSP